MKDDLFLFPLVKYTVQLQQIILFSSGPGWLAKETAGPWCSALQPNTTSTFNTKGSVNPGMFIRYFPVPLDKVNMIVTFPKIIVSQQKQFNLIV